MNFKAAWQATTELLGMLTVLCIVFAILGAVAYVAMRYTAPVVIVVTVVAILGFWLYSYNYHARK